MQGKLKDAKFYFRLKSAWPSSLYVARGKKQQQKPVREDGGKGRRYSS